VKGTSDLLRLFLPLCLWQYGVIASAAEQADARVAMPSEVSCDPCAELTGDWGGRRIALLADGVEIGLANTGDSLFIRQGENDDVTYTNLFEVGLAFDMEKLANMHGGSAYVWAVGTHGDDPAGVIGSIHAPSNIAAPDAVRLLEAWYEQGAYDDRLGVLVGFYAVDTEFDTKETLAIFAGGSHGTGLELSESGLNGPSIFPVTSFGTRIRLDVSHNVTARLTVLDGVPGELDDPTATAVFRFSSDEGLFAIAEMDYENKSNPDFLRFVLGGWHYTADFDDVLDTAPDGSPVRRSGSSGFYGFTEWLMFREPYTSDQGLAGVIRLGVADEDVNQIAGYYGAGLVYRGLFPGRDQDSIGLGFSTAINGDKFKQAQEIAGDPVTDSETELSLVYSAKVSRWFVLQPVVQYYIDPGTDPAADNALVVGMRISVLL
jgi:porin